eukprot:NODE_3489_length_549_cov_33.042000_g2951_i0.p2 GENE.NODE_3489_length_549_cov_33.042000_g2951_i0~~NODE_3489_length_549_cov_33.042000_g2951_i0.p2  ORF type:complete len:103 (-),score=7.28 NODE_3489_length_549_cov_33.042000_g2951_i0:3-311(-)
MGNIPSHFNQILGFHLSLGKARNPPADGWHNATSRSNPNEKSVGLTAHMGRGRGERERETHIYMHTTRTHAHVYGDPFASFSLSNATCAHAGQQFQPPCTLR